MLIAKCNVIKLQVWTDVGHILESTEESTSAWREDQLVIIILIDLWYSYAWFLQMLDALKEEVSITCKHTDSSHAG